MRVTYLIGILIKCKSEFFNKKNNQIWDYAACNKFLKAHVAK